MRGFLLVSVLLLLLLTATSTSQTLPGTVLDEQKISTVAGGLTAPIEDGAGFGSAVVDIGDLDGDGVHDIAVGAIWANGHLTFLFDAGEVWILFLNADGTVKSHQQIGAKLGGFGGELDDQDFFGFALASLGDLDGDGVGDLAIGVPGLDGPPGHGPVDRFGGIWICFLNRDGTVKAEQLISSTEGNFTGSLHTLQDFGSALARIDDLDGDGVDDLAVGSRHRADGGEKRGAVYILFMQPDGTVREHQRISDTEGGFDGVLEDIDHLGWAVASLGDLDGDGLTDIAATVAEKNDGCPGLEGCNANPRVGGLFIIFLNADGTVKDETLISATEGDFHGLLDNDDGLGTAVTTLGDLDGDGVVDIAVSAVGDDDGGLDTGAIWIMHLRTDGTVKSHRKITPLDGHFSGAIDTQDFFGLSLGTIDIDADGRVELLVGAQLDDDGGNNRGAVWTLWLQGSGTWQNLGHDLAGSTGYPRLEPLAKLAAGTPFRLQLSGALPDGVAWLTFGVAALNAPCSGGVLVPDLTPPGFGLPLLVDPAGQLFINDVWPAGVPGGAEFYLQYWIEDVGADFGLSASNALVATTP